MQANRCPVILIQRNKTKVACPAQVEDLPFLRDLHLISVQWNESLVFQFVMKNKDIMVRERDCTVPVGFVVLLQLKRCEVPVAIGGMRMKVRLKLGQFFVDQIDSHDALSVLLLKTLYVLTIIPANYVQISPLLIDNYKHLYG